MSITIPATFDEDVKMEVDQNSGNFVVTLSGVEIILSCNEEGKVVSVDVTVPSSTVCTTSVNDEPTQVMFPYVLETDEKSSVISHEAKVSNGDDECIVSVSDEFGAIVYCSHEKMTVVGGAVKNLEMREK